MSVSGSRRSEISALNVAFCLIVIFIHISSVPVSSLSPSSPAFVAIFIPHRLSSFVVPGFIFLSGLKLYLSYSGKRDYRRFYRTRFLKILLPYMLWVVVYYIYFVRHGYFSFSMADLLAYLLNGTLSSHFYFVVIIVQFYLLVPLFDRMLGKIEPALLLICSLMLMVALGQNLPQIISFFLPQYDFIYNDRVFTTYLFYWVLGCCAGIHYERFKDALQKNSVYITLLFVFSAVLDIGFHYLGVSGRFFLAGIESIHILYCVAAVFFAAMCATLIFETKVPLCKLAQAIDGASYYIYLSHCLLLVITNDYLYRLGITRILIAYAIRGAVVYVGAIGLCILYTVLKRKLLGSAQMKK